MMPRAFYVVVAVLFASDAALSRWRPTPAGAAGQPRDHHALRSALALVIAYLPILVLPALSPLGVTLLAATVGMAGLWSFSRLVGLTGHPRFFGLTLLCALSFFVAARIHWHGLFRAMPVYAMFLVAGAGTVRGEAPAFLQKMCLSWVGLVVYGYLFAHAAVFTDTKLGDLPPAQQWIAIVLVCAKAGDVAWEAGQRAGARAKDLQIPITAAGGALGGAAVHLAVPEALTAPQLALMGAIVGMALGAASRTYKLIVADVVGEDPTRPMKGTMLFGFAFALALAYHYVSYLAG
jgi:predicted CDP-diglyceride synthetase/phosphatidate cytidylyltransferase